MPTARSVMKTSISDPRTFLRDTKDAVDRVLSEWCARVREETPGRVGEAMAYSLSSSGKRLRPALLLAVYQELGGEGDATELATAIEVVHTYSLVHDDLPCMDDDDMRRGRHTTHREFDVPTATEAGFRLVPLALRILRSGVDSLRIDSVSASALAVELFEAAGAAGMIRGQVLDLEAEGSDVKNEELVSIHESKTGALITASCVMGAHAAGGNPDQVNSIRGYGAAAGLAFQIVDDILDATVSSTVLGKTAGKDAEQQKATFVTMLGLEAAREAAKQQVQVAIDHLTSTGLDSGLLSALAHYIVERGN